MTTTHIDLSAMGSKPFDAEYALHILPQTLDHARDIGISLLRSFVERPSYVLGVTSTLPAEGKTTISSALAEVMATDFGLDVILLDGNAERPWTFQGQEDSPRRGLSDWLRGDCDFVDAVVRVHDKCTIMPLGAQPMSSRDVLQRIVNSSALQNLREHFSLILMDLPDLHNPAAAALANLCDGIVLVIRSGVTPVDRVREFLPLLENVTMHGAVLNRDIPKTPVMLRRAFS